MTYSGMKTSGMWCQENDKSSPCSHLSLPPAASIFSSTHYAPRSHSARASSPLFSIRFLAFSYSPALTLHPFRGCFFPSMSLPSLAWLAFLQLSSLLPFLSLASFLLSHLVSPPPSLIFRLPPLLPPHLDIPLCLHY